MRMPNGKRNRSSRAAEHLLDNNIRGGCKEGKAGVVRAMRLKALFIMKAWGPDVLHLRYASPARLNHSWRQFGAPNRELMTECG
jgi:O-acetyl-ADP-ribose deacetylase (regulator of RNase III)